MVVSIKFIDYKKGIKLENSQFENWGIIFIRR